jgi:hypothetical protein
LQWRIDARDHEFCPLALGKAVVLSQGLSHALKEWVVNGSSKITHDSPRRIEPFATRAYSYHRKVSFDTISEQD